MKPDFYTKLILTIIAVLLACNAFSPIHRVQAQQTYRIHQVFPKANNIATLPNGVPLDGNVVGFASMSDSCYAMTK